MHRTTSTFALLISFVLLAACGGGGDDVAPDTDGGPITMMMGDAGSMVPEADGGVMPEIDGGATPDIDGGVTPEIDSGVECPDGMAGPTCEDCAPGFVDMIGDGTCEPGCDATGADALDCGAHGACMYSPADGLRYCACDEGYDGAVCDVCETGFFPSGGACELDEPPALGLSLWLDADATDTIDLNASMQVTAWRDRRSFITLEALPTTGIAQPAFQPTGRNGRGSVVFDGTDDQMTINGYNGLSATDFEIIFAGEPNGSTVGLIGAQSGTTDWAVMIDRQDSTDFRLTYRRPPGTTGGNDVTVDRASPARPMYIAASHQSSGATDSLAIFASDDPSEASGVYLFPAPSAPIGSTLNLRIGRTQAGRMSGKIYEILIYSRRLTVAEREEVATYLRAKWNLP
jgi:hypothetical protein